VTQYSTLISFAMRSVCWVCCCCRGFSNLFSAVNLDKLLNEKININ